jgi:hypothetical protein
MSHGTWPLMTTFNVHIMLYKPGQVSGPCFMPGSHKKAFPGAKWVPGRAVVWGSFLDDREEALWPQYSWPVYSTPTFLPGLEAPSQPVLGT